MHDSKDKIPTKSERLRLMRLNLEQKQREDEKFKHLLKMVLLTLLLIILAFASASNDSSLIGQGVSQDAHMPQSLQLNLQPPRGTV
ncbi:MAG: hypothetical protein HQL48_06085 [Gammaproteobacteria bacterium]|nr:hypothetical protein [Gammaproteobacteria bacterium]